MIKVGSRVRIDDRKTGTVIALRGNACEVSVDGETASRPIDNPSLVKIGTAPEYVEEGTIVVYRGTTIVVDKVVVTAEFVVFYATSEFCLRVGRYGVTVQVFRVMA